MNLSSVINQMIELFIIMAVGFIAYKTKIMNDQSNQSLSKLILYVPLPAMILAAVLNNEHKLSNLDVLLLLALAIVMYVFLILFSYLLTWILHVPEKQKGIYRYLQIFTNVGFMGFPVVNAIWGSEAVFYASMFQIPFSFLSYTLGIQLIAGEKQAPNLKKAFLHPGVISSILALILYLFNIQMPTVVCSTLDTIGKITTPSSMIIIGSTIASFSLKKAFSQWKIYPMSIVKQVFVPLLFWFCLSFLNLDPLMLGVTVVMTAMPCATNSTILCHEYGGDAELSASGVFLSTIISVVTIPILAYFLMR